MLSPCFPHAFPTHSTRNPPAFNRHSPRFQYAFPFLCGAFVVGDDVRSLKLQPTPPTLSGSRVQALFTPCTSLVQAVYTLCTRSVHAMLTGCTRSVQALYLALYWPCTSRQPSFPTGPFRHSALFLLPFPQYGVALGCLRLESNLQVVGDSGPVWMASSADSGAGAGWPGVGMAVKAPHRRHIGSTGAPHRLHIGSADRPFCLENRQIQPNQPQSTDGSCHILARSYHSIVHHKRTHLVAFDITATQMKAGEKRLLAVDGWNMTVNPSPASDKSIQALPNNDAQVSPAVPAAVHGARAFLSNAARI